MEKLETKSNEEIPNKIQQLLNRIQQLKEEINKLEQEILSIQMNKDTLEYVFSKLNGITHGQINTIIFVSNNNVKYLTRDPSSSFGILLINSNKAYLLDVESYELKENTLEIAYFEQYNLSDDIISDLKEVHESNIDYANPLIFQLYYLLKKYPVSFVKIKYD